MAHDPNLPHLLRVADRLGDLCDELLLVGGTAAGLLVDDPGAAPIRPTEDIDLVVEATTYATYDAFTRRLMAVGLTNEQGANASICRWRAEGVVLDVMPLDEAVLGFSNRWYHSAFESPIRFDLANGRSIKLIDGPHFLASKLEAFRSRGENDPLMSHDLEDFVVVVEGRLDVVAEVMDASSEVRAFIATNLEALLADRYFADALQGYFMDSADSVARARFAHERLLELTRLG